MTYKTKGFLILDMLNRKWKECPLRVSSIPAMLPAHMAILLKHQLSNGVLGSSVLKQTGPWRRHERNYCQQNKLPCREITQGQGNAFHILNVIPSQCPFICANRTSLLLLPKLFNFLGYLWLCQISFTFYTFISEIFCRKYCLQLQRHETMYRFAAKSPCKKMRRGRKWKETDLPQHSKN